MTSTGLYRESIREHRADWRRRVTKLEANLGSLKLQDAPDEVQP